MRLTFHGVSFRTECGHVGGVRWSHSHCIGSRPLHTAALRSLCQALHRHHGHGCLHHCGVSTHSSGHPVQGTRSTRAPGACDQIPFALQHCGRWGRKGCADTVLAAPPANPISSRAPQNTPGLPTPPAGPSCTAPCAGRSVVGGPAAHPSGKAAPVPAARPADGKQSMEFARLQVKYNTQTDFVRGPGTAAFAGSD